MSTTTNRAAEVLWSAECSDGLRAIMRPDCMLLAQALADAGLLATDEHDEQVRADERARVSVVHSTLTDEQLVAELVRRGVLEEQVVPAFHGFGFTEPAVRRHVTKGEQLPPDPPPTQEQIDALRRRLTGDGGTS